MAFIKKNYRRGHCYYSIVEGYIENGKVKHRTLLYLGRPDNLTEEKRRRIEAAVNGVPPGKAKRNRRKSMQGYGLHL